MPCTKEILRMKLSLLAGRGSGSHERPDTAVREILDQLGDGSISHITFVNEGPLIRVRARSPKTHEQPMGLGPTVAEGCTDLLRDLAEAVRHAPTRAPDGRPLLRLLPGGVPPNATRLPTTPTAS
jgi:hypothetical protein